MYSLLNRHLDALLASIEEYGGVTDYKYLITAFRNTNVSRDDKFQRIYRSYCRWEMLGYASPFAKHILSTWRN